MPEGDTVARTAANLRAVLGGARLRRVELPRWPGRPLPVGATVTAVDPVGKHLVIRTDAAVGLHVHLGMHGRWRIGPDRGRPARPADVAVLATGRREARCSGAPVVEVLDDAGLRRRLAHLGPDLATPAVDLAAAAARLATVGDRAVGDALLDQRVVAGVGNVWRSEVLWAVGIHPRVPVRDLSPTTVAEVVATAHRLIRANLTTPARRTHRGGLAVYGRHGRPCPRCGTAVRAGTDTERGRAVWWCPTCQPPPDR